MIVFINEKEAAALTLYTKMMRPSFRKLLKAKYKANKDDYLQSYDYIAAEVEKALEGQYTAYAVNMNIRDLEILHEFLRSLIDKLQPEAEQVARKDKNKAAELQDHLLALCAVRDKARGTMYA